MDAAIDREAEMHLGCYGRMAVAHWRRWLPEMTATLEASGELSEAASAAERQTIDDLIAIEDELQKAGHLPGQAAVIAWKLVRERYILIAPEEGVE